MRKVVLRWNISSLRGAKELSRILEIAERVEVLGHLAVSDQGVTQLAEIKMREGHSVNEISNLDSFEVLEQHEEDDDGILVSLLCKHPLAISAIEMSNIHIQPPYGVDADRGDGAQNLRPIQVDSQIPSPAEDGPASGQDQSSIN